MWVAGCSRSSNYWWVAHAATRNDMWAGGSPGKPVIRLFLGFGDEPLARGSRSDRVLGPSP